MKAFIAIGMLASLIGCSKSPHPNDLVTTQTFGWRRIGFETILETDFSIRNNTDSAIKDIKVTCKGYSGTGTKIDSNTRTIYKVINPGETVPAYNFSMGFLHSEVQQINCYTVSFVTR